MSDIRCTSCGKDNPDFLDVCQFCQTPLTHDSMLQIGQSPTKKNTGELEPILPEWLRDVRKQGRESAEEEAAISATQPKIQKNEAPDLLAGLASQSDDEDDDVPDWLANINPVVKQKPSESPAPEPSNDFFAQFTQSKAAPEIASEPPKEETPSWRAESAPSKPEQPAEKDELSDWLSSTPQESSAPFASQPAPEEKEDLSWLHNLEASAKQADTPSQPKQQAVWNFDAPAAPSSSQEDLSWLSNLGGTSEPVQPVLPQPSKQEDLSWLDNLGGTSAPVQSNASQPSQSEDLSWLNALGGSSESVQPDVSQPSQQEDLSWLNTLGGTSEPVQPTAQQQPSKQEDLSWLDALGGTPEPVQPTASQPSQSDDLSWLNNLGEPSEPAQATSTPPSAPQEDLGWLNNLGGSSEPAQPVPAPTSSEDLSWLDTLGGVLTPEQPASVPSSSQDDLGWLKELSGTSEPAQETPAAQEDLGWLNNLGGVAEPAQQVTPPSMPEGEMDWLGKLDAAAEPVQPEPSESTSPNELDWLKSFAASSEPSQPAPAEPAAAQSDIDWLAGLGDASAMPGYISAKPFGATDELNPPQQIDENAPSRISPFVPRRTAPLNEDAFNDTMPDWLKSATEETPNLPLGADALEQFRETPLKPLDKGPLPSTPEPFSSAQDKPDFVGSNVFSSSNEPRSLSSQDVDSLFSVDMPDWLSKPQPEASDITPQKTGTPTRDESLSPVELPSWVQAMRPVESVLSETGPSIETQPTEKEGPLAGLRGVIPSAPIGSSRRPKAISLKLLATDEQQAGASLFDQILAGEVMPRVMESSSTFASQNVLRWAIAGILMVVLFAILFMRSQLMPVSADLPPDVNAATNAINAIPNNSSVLVVVDYEPSLAGEMEAVSAPVLNQIILAHQPKLVLLSTSPNNAGLIERLLSSAHITAPDGFAYTLGNQYFNLGYLPGGPAGIIGFITQPHHMIASATAQRFSEYSAVILLTDNSESGRAWVEQLDVAKQADSDLATQSVILVTSAQAGPLLQPYVSSKQAAGMVNGLADAARFEYANALPPANRIARTYWDAFGIGILMAILLIIIGSVWSLVIGIRARRVSGEQG